MRRLVRCACILLVFGFIFTACTKQDKVESENREKESLLASDLIKTSISQNNYERYDLLMTKYINDTKIYGISVSNGIYDKVQVEISGNTKDFEWLSLADDEYLPYITYADVNADTINECIIIMNEDLGDGVIRQHIHILNAETLDEIEIEDANEYIENKLSSKKDGDMIVILLDDVVIYTYSKNENNETNENTETVEVNEEQVEISEDNILEFVFYDDYITYKVNGNLIQANVKFIFDGEEVNSIDITYELTENKLICKAK